MPRRANRSDAPDPRFTPEQRSMRARIAGNTRWAHTADRTAATAPGRAAFLRRFDDQVDPDRKLPEAERARRAESARKAHFARLALASSRARAARKGGPLTRMDCPAKTDVDGQPATAQGDDTAV